MPLLALVVDDSMLIRHTVCRFLEARGFAVEPVCNGQEALHKLQELTPDLIVTDVKMPQMDGTEFITAIKLDARTAQIPIVIVAGESSGFDRNEQRVNYAIRKDIDLEGQLRKALRAIFGEAAGAS